jgi:glycosyltransferase involved in cell wall biosynthesis
MKLSIIIPAHNEQATVAEVIKKVADADIGNWEKEILAVDDGSSDKTAEILKASGSFFSGRRETVCVIYHQKNLGKGAAIKSALAKATGDYVLIQDADLEYDPKDIFNLLSPVNNGGQKMAVFGDRGIKRYPERGFHYIIGAKLLTWAFNILNGAWLRDLYTGYKLIPADIFKSLGIKSTGFEFEAEVACKLLKKGIKILEVPIANYRPRSRQQGKHIRFKDAALGLLTIISCRVS